MVVAERLSKSYGSRLALDCLDLRVSAGSVLGFIGPNGAGKTTTMRMLAGTMPQSSGRVSICGFDMAEDPLKAKALIGYLPENAPLYSHTKVKAFLEFCARMRGLPEPSLKDAVEKAAARCALEEVMDEEMDALSKGFRRRACLAQAIIHEPQALLLDEPTDGLDPIQKIQMRALIKELRPGKAIIVSTHILEEVDAVCTDVLAIAGGKALFNGSVESFRACGEGPCLELELSGPATEAQALEALRTLPSALSAEARPGAAHARILALVRCKAGCEGRAAAEAIDALRAAGLRIERCSHAPAGRLDEIFTALVAGQAKARSGENGGGRP